MVASSWQVKDRQEEPERYPRQLSVTSYVLPEYVTPIDAHGNAYAATLCPEQLEELARLGIRTVVRMNGNTRNDLGCMSIEQEATKCKDLGIRFYYENCEGRVKDAGQVVANLMRKGGVVVHCRNGAHRAPAMAAYHLRQEGYRRDMIVRLVGWESRIQSPGQYKKYTQAVLPG